MSYTKREFNANEKNGIRTYTNPGKEDTNERTHLQQPVKLQPSWEENNLPEDELNFKNLTMDDASLQLNTPPDRYHLVYITFLIHGIGVLMPWNMFINAIDYFTKYKLGKTYIGFVFPYAANFMQLLTFSAQVPSLLFSWMNIFVQIGGNLTTRIVWSIGVEVVMFLITVVIAMCDTSAIPYGFFWITMICVVLINIANGIYQNTVFGMAAKLPGKYTGAVILGTNISGTFTAIVSLVSSLMTPNARMAAIYYFITSLFVLLICFDTYFALPLNRYYRHYELKEKKEIEKQRRFARGAKERIPYMYILKKCYPQLLNVFLVFFVTLAIFPAMHSEIKPYDEDFFIPTKYYSSITCFVTFNVFAMIGSWLPSYYIWPGPKFLWIPVSLRLLYIPFYLLCNYMVDGEVRILPVLISNDWVYWIVAVTMALSSGYFSSLGMMYTPRMVEERYATTAGMFAAAALVTGIFSGILISFLWPWIIAHVGN